MEKSKLFKQRLFALHIAAGITFSIIMYLAVYFGVFAIFLPQIQAWEKPSRYIEKVDITKIDYNYMVEEALKNPDFPKDNILINLPGRIGETAVNVTNRFVKPVVFDPFTKEILEDEGKEITNLASFLNELHYGQPLKLLGRLAFGFTAVGTLALVITGLLLIYYFKFNYKTKNQQGLFSTLHVKIFTWAFLPFLLITISGGVMNVGLISAPPMAKMLTKGEAKAIDELVGSTLFPTNKAVKKENISASMLPLNELLLKAQEINPQLTFKQIKLSNWNDITARVEFSGYNPYKPFLNGGIFNIPYVALNAHTGELLENKKVLDNTVPVFIAEGLFFLHFLFGIDIFSRTIIAILMGLCGVAIGFGVMLWLEKKAKKVEGKITFYHWMGKLSLATMVGVIPATAILFVLQWILPFGLEDRVLWQQGIFYNVWLFTLFWSFYRINSYQASKEFLFIGGILFVFASLLHFIKFQVLISNILGVDIALALFGILLIFIAKKLPKRREDFILAKILNKGKTDE
ncbi:PepSY-associated TM helix domain-containing protein [Aliarcobacter lanthieri]|uniref:PepSY-associated TM helix domain-containing protein n=1 Tax=Aliarcobacter lanthieri TaxID=1355374 RepID=UPI00047C8743|nr:PepSY-associated TM helix domain-containing protein [Aliarcobacter lanthieri]QKF60015.1 PepSY domain-containing membrane protein [Aliarcobacter lanthieri]